MTTRRKNVFLKGARLLLRTIEPDDATTAACWLNDPDVRKYLGLVNPLTVAEERDHIAEMAKRKDELVFVIEVRKKRRLIPIGLMGLHRIDHRNGTATTGALIGNTAYQNCGYGSEAKFLLLDYAFNLLNLRVIKSRVLAFNARSYRYNRTCGYLEIGRLPLWQYRPDQKTGVGVYHDEIIMVITRECFNKLRKRP